MYFILIAKWNCTYDTKNFDLFLPLRDIQ